MPLPFIVVDEVWIDGLMDDESSIVLPELNGLPLFLFVFHRLRCFIVFISSFSYFFLMFYDRS